MPLRHRGAAAELRSSVEHPGLSMTDGDWSAVDYVVIDVEGNGARPPELVELAAVPIRQGNIGDVSTWLVRPPTPISWQASRVHGIGNDDVAQAPTIEDVAGDIRAVLGEAIPVGYGVHVDVAVLRRSLPGWEPPIALDTLKLARRAFDLPSYRLEALVEHRQLASGLPSGMRAHRADYDAIVTARLFVELTSTLAPVGPTLAALRQAAGTGASSTRSVEAQATLFDL